MSNFKQVTKGEFQLFLDSYPTELSFDIARMFEPPLFTANDFSSGKKWPDSAIAKAHLTEGEEYFGFEPTSYFVRIN